MSGPPLSVPVCTASQCRTNPTKAMSNAMPMTSRRSSVPRRILVVADGGSEPSAVGSVPPGSGEAGAASFVGLFEVVSLTRPPIATAHRIESAMTITAEASRDVAPSGRPLIEVADRADRALYRYAAGVDGGGLHGCDHGCPNRVPKVSRPIRRSSRRRARDDVGVQAVAVGVVDGRSDRARDHDGSRDSWA